MEYTLVMHEDHQHAGTLNSPMARPQLPTRRLGVWVSITCMSRHMVLQGLRGVSLAIAACPACLAHPLGAGQRGAPEGSYMIGAKCWGGYIMDALVI